MHEYTHAAGLHCMSLWSTACACVYVQLEHSDRLSTEAPLYTNTEQLYISPGTFRRDCQAGPHSHTRGQGTGPPPPAGVRSPAVWQCRISVGVNGLCLTFSVRPCDQISSSFKIGTNYIIIDIPQIIIYYILLLLLLFYYNVVL